MSLASGVQPGINPFLDDPDEGFRLIKASHKRLKPATLRARGLLEDAETPEELRFEALLALGRVADPETLDPVIRTLEQFPDRLEPITAVGLFRNSSPVPQLLKRLENPDEPYADEIVRVLGQIGDPMATRQLLELLQSQDRMVRYHAAWALYRIGGRDVVPGLCRLLSDPDEWIVINVLEILAQLREPDAVPALVGQFEIVEDPRLKAIIISSLAAFAEPQLLGVFEKALQSFDPRIQANAVEAVASLKISALEVRRKLKAFLRHPNNRVRANVAVAVFAADAETVAGEVQAMMQCADAPTRRSAAYVLSRIPLEGRDALIDRLLADAHYGVRKMALRAALALSCEVGIDRISRLLTDENQWVRKEAVECAIRLDEFPADTIIQRFSAEDATPVLASMLRFFVHRRLNATVPAIMTRLRRQPDEELLVELLDALGRLEAGEAIAEARRLLVAAGPTVQIRLSIASLLQGDLSVIDELVQRLQGLSRPDGLRDGMKVLGAVGEFLRRIEDYSRALTRVLMDSALADLDPSLLVGGMPGRPPAEPEPELVFDDGVALFNQGRFDEALPFFERFVARHPDHVDGAYHLGAVQFKLGRLPEARQRLEAVVKAHPEHVATGLLLGQIYFQRKEWMQLIELYDELRERVPAGEKRVLGQIHGALGLSRFHLKEFQSAIQSLKRAIQCNPKDLGSVYHLALSLYAIKDFAQARVLLERLTTELPPKSQVLRNVEELIQKLEDEM